MSEPIVDSARPVTLLGGGQATPACLDDALSLAPLLVAADGGADMALARGHLPAAVIGDLDSLGAGARAALPPDRLHRIAEQDTTDFDKALRSIRAPLVLGVGFLGARLDHQLANFTVLLRRPVPPCVLIGAEDVVFAVPPGREIALPLAPGTRVSLYPMVPVAGRSEGLHWPIEGIAFAPDGAVGTSNRVAERHAGPVILHMEGPGMLVILPRAALAAACAALGQGGPPPARAR